MTVAAVAEQLKLNPQTVRNWIQRDLLPAVRVGPRRVRVRQSDLDQFLKLSTDRVDERQAPDAPPEGEELLSRTVLADRLHRSVSWVDARVREGMPYEPPSGVFRHRRFRVGEVRAWLDERADAQSAQENEGAEGADAEQLATALSEAASAANHGDQSQLADALRAVAKAAERLADVLERTLDSVSS